MEITEKVMIVFRKNTAESDIAVWQLTESEAELLQLLGGCRVPSVYKNPTRRLEFLAEKLLLKNLCGENDFEHLPSGKPFLRNSEIHISFSHTKGYVALIASREHQVGIDIEYPSARINRVKERFLSSVELLRFQQNQSSLLLTWCAKEALYKVLETPLLDFAKQIEVYPFEVKTEGEFLAKSVTDSTCEHKLDYICTDDYFLVWVVKNE